MRKPVIGAAVFAALLAVSGCTSIPTSDQPPGVDMTMARSTVKIYDVMPPNGRPIEQISVTACDGTRERATDKLLGVASQRGGNGISGLACTDEGMSFSCWKSSTCTAMAINVVEPPPPPPPPLRRGKPAPKPKPKKKT